MKTIELTKFTPGQNVFVLNCRGVCNATVDSAFIDDEGLEMTRIQLQHGGIVNRYTEEVFTSEKAAIALKIAKVKREIYNLQSELEEAEEDYNAL